MSLSFVSLAAGGEQYPNYDDIHKKNLAKYNISKLKPLATTLNSDLTKNRINIIFTFDNSIDELKLKVIEAIQRLDSGVLSVEPFKTYKDSLNFWYFEESVNEQEFVMIEDYFEFQGVNFASMVKMLDGSDLPKTTQFLDFKRSNADLPFIKRSEDNKEVLSFSPGNIRLYYEKYLNENDKPVFYVNTTTLIHELGHSILALSDEYEEAGKAEPILRYPNCASSEEEAKLWWGDLIGKVEPEFYEYQNKEIEFAIKGSPEIFERKDGKIYLNLGQYDEKGNFIKTGQEEISKNFFVNEEDYRVTLTNRGGCYSEKNEIAYRPTKKSIMNTDILYFGYVNRIEGEKILKIFNKSTPPVNFNNATFNSIEEFDQGAISSPQCKVKDNGKNLILNCLFYNQKESVSNKIKFGYKIADALNFKYTPLNEISIQDSCVLSSDKTQISCEGIIVDKLDFNSDKLLVLQIDSRSLYKDKEIAFIPIYEIDGEVNNKGSSYNSMIPFKLKDLIQESDYINYMLRNLPPKETIKPESSKVSLKKNVDSSTIKRSTVRTGGHYNLLFLIPIFGLASAILYRKHNL
ncbi:MAG: M64 family metallopeptidase [Patescibacteria group bacterium]